MIVAATVLVVAAALGALLWPVLRRSRVPLGLSGAPDAAGVGARDEALLEARESAVAALGELDFDYAVGKLAEADYRALRARYEQRALALLKATDQLERTAGYGAPVAPAAPSMNGVPGLHAEPWRQSPERAAADAARGEYRNGTAAPPATSRPLVPAGAGHPLPRPGARGRGRWTLVAAAGLAVVFVAGVAGLYAVNNLGPRARAVTTALEGVGPRALALAPDDGRTAFLAAAAGLWTSADGGATWQPVAALDAASGASAGTPLRAVATSAARPARLYAAGPGLVVRSDDGGRSWTALPLALPTDAAASVAASPAGSAGAPTRGGGDAASAPPAGSSASAQATASSATADVRALAVDPFDAERVWLIVEGTGALRGEAGVFRWEGAEQRWTRTGPAPPANGTALVVLADGPDEPRYLYLASATEGVLASADEGRTWGPASGALSGALPTRRVSSLAWDAASGDTATTPDGRTLRGTLYAGADQGVFKSVDRGALWARLPLDAAVAAVAAGGDVARPLLLVADREGHLYRSTSRGVTWDGR